MLIAALAVSLLLIAPQTQVPPQDPVAAQDPVALEDITVTGRPLQSMIEEFVREVGEPNAHRSLARWDRDVCVSVVNLQPEPAQYLVDRISTVAEDLGLNPGAPGCTANVVIIATNDAQGLTQTLATERPRAFRLGGAGMARGPAAFEDFQMTPRPVRWWQQAMPIDSVSGQTATRIPGECRGACGSVLSMAPNIKVLGASRINSQIVDNLFRAIVVVDVDDVAELSIVQLADFIAMVTLAQIDPEADTSGYTSILNVFDDPEASPALTTWDTAYLQGLYAAERNKHNPGSNRSEISRAISREHARLRQTAALEEAE